VIFTRLSVPPLIADVKAFDPNKMVGRRLIRHGMVPSIWFAAAADALALSATVAVMIHLWH